MKHRILILFSVVLLSGCNPLNPDTGLPYGWLPIPKERIKSYFPQKNDTVTYISENNETLSYRCYISGYRYHPYGEKDTKIPDEDFFYDNGLECTSDASKRLDCNLLIGCNRTYLYITGSYPGNWGVFEKRFENDYKKDQGAGYPKYPNEFIEYLTDTIEFINRDTDELTGILVSGKGLAWFTDHEGVKWYLQK